MDQVIAASLDYCSLPDEIYYRADCVDQHVDVVRVLFDEAIDMVMRGEINANSSAHALLKVEKLLRIPPEKVV